MISKFFRSIYSKLILALMDTRLYHWVVKYLVPRLRFTSKYAKVNGIQHLIAYRLLKQGDILVSSDYKKASALFIPGNWDHAALVIDKDSKWEISEMTAKDYTKSTFFDFCKTCDRFAILRCVDWDADYIKDVVIPTATSEIYQNAKYDTGFSFNISDLYCSELIYHADVEKRLQVDLSDLIGIGRMYLSPQGLSQGKNLTVIYDSDWDKNTKP